MHGAGGPSVRPGADSRSGHAESPGQAARWRGALTALDNRPILINFKRMEDERKTLVLTGASRGIGHATVKRFNAAGWRVITCSRHAFSEDCPWEAGPEDHLVIDLADHASTREPASKRCANASTACPLHALGQ